ncbi:MAG: pilus assembly protein PilM [Solirubrobacterales bacterium]
MLRRKKPTTLVGLDIDAGSLAAVEVEVHGSKTRVVKTAVMPLEAGLFRDGEVTDVEGLSAAIAAMFEEHNLSKKVRLGLANQRIAVRSLRLPFIEDKQEMETAIRFQAQDHIPMPLEQAVLDYTIAERIIGSGGEELALVVVAAARRDMTGKFLDCLREASLQPMGLDVSAFAMVRALRRSFEPVPGTGLAPVAGADPGYDPAQGDAIDPAFLTAGKEPAAAPPAAPIAYEQPTPDPAQVGTGQIPVPSVSYGDPAHQVQQVGAHADPGYEDVAIAGTPDPTTPYGGPGAEMTAPRVPAPEGDVFGAGSDRTNGIHEVGFDAAYANPVSAYTGMEPAEQADTMVMGYADSGLLGASEQAETPAAGLADPVGVEAGLPHSDEAGSVAEDTETVLYCNFGDSTNLAVARGDVCVFTRVSTFGIEGIAQRLSEQRRLSLEHARQWLVHIGLEQPLDAIEGDDETLHLGREVLEAGAVKLADELRVSLDFYGTQDGAEPPTRIRACGPGAAIPGLLERVGILVGMPVEERRPSALTTLDAAEVPRLVLAYGLAVSD